MSNPLPTRQVHLDFHTGPAIPDVGVEFNATEFASALVEARVNSITLFAKCHHGHLYYDTNRPERHPGLSKKLHLLEDQIEACRSKGIRAPIYLSVMCDEYAANLHPEWLCRNVNGSHVGRPQFNADAGQWQILDMSSPYVDFLEEQIVEVVKKFKPVDGIFLDMCWDQPTVSKYAIDIMRKEGLDPTLEADRAVHARRTVHRYMERYNNVITKLNGSLPRVWYNSRPKTALSEEKKFLKHIEIEALPTGGWGYTYFPLNVRWARNFGLPFLGMTARFHKSWSDFGGYKPDAALKYEVSQMIAQGGDACSIGDQLHPRGRLDVEAYRRIGRAYRHIESIEPYFTDAKPVTEVAVLRDPNGVYTIKPGGTLEGTVRLLQQLLVQFDFVAPTSDFSKYPLAIVPEDIDLSGEAGTHLLKYLNTGGKVLLAGVKPLQTAPAELRTAAGVSAIETNGAKTPFFRYDPRQIPDAEASDVVSYDGTLRLTPTSDARVPGVVIEPYFQRSWDRFCGHNQSPPATATATAFAPATLTPLAAAIGFDVFACFGTHGQTHVRRLLRYLLDGLLPAPLTRGLLPSHVEVTVSRQSSPDRLVVHVLSYAPQRRTPALDLVEEATPLVGAKVSVRSATSPKRVTLEPAGMTMPFTYQDGYVTFEWSSTNGHDLIVVE